jgi:uncharacterized paraquat-inducible protein A
LTYDFLIGQKTFIAFFSKVNPAYLDVDISNTNMPNISQLFLAAENYRNLVQMSKFFNKFNIEITDLKMGLELDNVANHKNKPKTDTRKRNTCAYCHRLEEENEKFKVCARCKKVTYCSRKCHVKDWKRGHKEDCKMAN